MPLVSKRGLSAFAITVGVVVASVSAANANASSGSPAAGSNASQRPQNVIVLLRDQHTNLAISKGKLSPRVTANRHDQSGAMASAKTHGAKNLRGFDTVNAYGATVTPSEATAIASDPAVLGVVPDLPIAKTGPTPAVAGPVAKSAAPSSASSAICPSNPAKPILEPEALQVTNTAFENATTPQAQSIVDGKGVKVGYIADGIDINNPDFIRANGTHVFTDYQDFSGEGPNAPSGAAEAFGDASSIAAQGREVYDLANFVSIAHPLPAGCNITVRGVAPGASLVGLKVFGNAATAPTSRFIEAIDYAVDVAGVDVLNESFGANPYPDTNDDPISLADAAAVAAGVTVVASTGDAGTNGTNGSPSTSDKVISVGATTMFRGYAQDDFAGFDLGNGTWANNNISSLSSGGVSQADRVPDLVAPGDSGWALCSPDVATYEECTDDNGGGSPIQLFGGTSQSSPLTAGAAALVIEAYEHAHHGVRPTPALVARLLTGTATDLGHPASEQGAGLLNSLGAVRAAESYQDGNGSPSPTGSALIANQPQFSAIGYPGTTSSTSVTLRNVSGHTQTVHATTRTLGKAITDVTGHVTLDTTNPATKAYVDSFGISRSYVTHTFKVGNVDRLSMSIASQTPVSPARVILLDPTGTYTAYSLPQGEGNFGNVDVRAPKAGTWTAIFALSTGANFVGPINYEITTYDFTNHGSVSPSTFSIAAGATKTIAVKSALPSQPGDLSTSLQLSSSAGGTTSIPVTLRSVIPPRNTTFTGTITGGNGRQTFGPAQATTYYLDVPSGKRDLSLGVTFPDPGVVVFGVLTAPDGQVYDYKTNVSSDGTLLFGGLQIYRRNPQAGRWTFSFDVTNPVSGLEVKQPFTAKVAYNSVDIHASLPDSASAHLAAGVPVNIPVTIKNTGAIPLTYFADGRLNTIGNIPLANLNSPDTLPLPVPAGVTPEWVLPTEVNQLTIGSTADQPVNLDIEYSSGDPEVYQANQNNGATVQVNAPVVSPGPWFADIGQSGPFTGPATPGTVSVTANAVGKLFDPAVTSTTGDDWLVGVDPAAVPALAAQIKASGLRNGLVASAKSGSGDQSKTRPTNASPFDLAPGASTTIIVTITPVGKPGSVVSGHLYIDTFDSGTFSGDELIDLPYKYTIGH